MLLTVLLTDTHEDDEKMSEDERRWISEVISHIEQSGLATASVAWPGRFSADGDATNGERAINISVSTQPPLSTRRAQTPSMSERASYPYH